MKIIYILLIILSIILSSLVGKFDLNYANIFHNNTVDYKIFTQVRIPRSILAFFSGAILSLAGLIFQALFKNPLTTPFTLGISSGATLGAALAIMFGINFTFMGFSFITFFAFLGSLSTLFLIIYLSKKILSSKDNRLILVGIALSFLYSSILLIIYYLSNFQDNYLILRFSMGTLLSVGYSDIIPITIAGFIVLYFSIKFKKELKLLSISDEFAYLRGVNNKKVLNTLFIAISLSVAIVVSICGPINFIGLIIPHIVRNITKKSIDRSIYSVFTFGGIFLLLCDTVSRVLPTISEVPVGIITSVIGGTLFIYILLFKSD